MCFFFKQKTAYEMRISDWSSECALPISVGPSAVMTEGAKEYFGAKFDKAKEVIAQGQALQRNLETDDLVGTIVYLMSDASKFVTGQIGRASCRARECQPGWISEVAV